MATSFPDFRLTVHFILPHQLTELEISFLAPNLGDEVALRPGPASPRDVAPTVQVSHCRRQRSIAASPFLPLLSSSVIVLELLASPLDFNYVYRLVRALSSKIEIDCHVVAPQPRDCRLP
jgi:hypothetical protein